MENCKPIALFKSTNDTNNNNLNNNNDINNNNDLNNYNTGDNTVGIFVEKWFSFLQKQIYTKNCSDDY